MPRSLQRTLLIVGVVACVLDFVVPYSVATAVPNYSHRTQFMSEIAAVSSGFALIMGAWWVLYGAALVGFAAALHRAMPRRDWPTALSTTALAIAGLGLGVGGGLFPCDPGCAGLSPSAQIHTLSALGGSLGLVLSPFLVWLALRSLSGWEGSATAAWVGGIVGIGCFAVFVTTSGPGADADSARGTWQRIFLAVYYVWLTSLALRCLRHIGESEALPAEPG